MTVSNPAVIVFLSVLALDVVAAGIFATQAARRRRREQRRVRARGILGGLGAGATVQPGRGDRSLRDADRFACRHRWLFLEECARTLDTVSLDLRSRAALASLLERCRTPVFLIRELNSRSRYRRMRAAAYLPLTPSVGVRTSLILALEREQTRTVKLALAASLAAAGEAAAIPTIIDTLAGEPLRYQRKLWGVLSEFGEDLTVFFPILQPRPEKEIQQLLIHFAVRYPSISLRDYLAELSDSADQEIAHGAFSALASAYPGSLDHARYLSHQDFLIRNLAAESLGKIPTARSLGLLFDHLEDVAIRRSAILAMTAIIRARPQHFRTVQIRCLNERRPASLTVLVEVLSNFVDHLMEKLLTPEAGEAAQVLKDIAGHGKLVEIINFLSRNTDPRIEQQAAAVLRELVAEDPGKTDELRKHLPDRLLGPLGLDRAAPPAAPVRLPEKPRLLLLSSLLLAGIVLVPAVSLLLALWSPSIAQAGAGLPRRFLAGFNTAFAVYGTILNGSYLIILCFSYAGARQQSRFGALRHLSFLFEEQILPSISIISPAFNEESSIVESVSSLLTLRYPDYEIIVVNDGSMDQTLERLVSYFNLERTDIFVHRFLSTQDIRAIYANKRYPELLVVDKQNGGKADALNAGINVARKEYFAGIDADSMLERDALLNLAGLFLNAEEEVVAAGGNILPVNGCTVRKGALVETRIPGNAIARFQTIEYIRAFMAGRVGWAFIKSLLIISGAFGVFHRRRVVNAHGYLTRSEHYAKDTVGEDMELVVRLTRRLREARTPFSFQYGYNANCWTEIPQTMRVLNRQRDRWQRGLLEIVAFHFPMMFNPRYGRTGLIGFPYFLIFEVLGPWMEAEGFLVLAASLALGAISAPLFLLLFTATVLLGLLVSIATMLIAEHQRQYFPLTDKLRLLLYAVLESFGFRQLMSLLRVRGFVRMMARVGGWGSMERRGLGASAVTPKGGT